MRRALFLVLMMVPASLLAQVEYPTGWPQITSGFADDDTIGMRDTSVVSGVKQRYFELSDFRDFLGGTWDYSTATALTSAGALASGAIDATTQLDGSLCGTNEILEDQGAAWACIATPAGGAEVNDLTATVTWANVPDANVTESSVTQHEAALSIAGAQVDSGTVPAARVGADHIDAITEIASALKSGADTTLVTGTAGADTECAQWNADGDLVTSGAGCGGGSSLFTDGGGDTYLTSLTDDLCVGGTSCLGNIGIHTASAAASFSVQSSATGGVNTSSFFLHNEGAYKGGLWWDEATDILQLDDSGSRSRIQFTAAGATVINEDSANRDFRVKSVSNANMIFVDAGNNRVGIGTSSPSATLHMLRSGTSISEASLFGADLVLQDTAASGQAIMALISNNSGTSSQLFFGDTDSALVGAITYAHSLDQMGFNTNGSQRMRIFSDGGVVVGSPTGNSQGAGTINAQAVFDDGTVLTDFVFEPDYSYLSMSDLATFIEREQHLPTIDGRKVWEEEGRFSLGKVASQLWETVEVQALYIVELNEKMKGKDDEMAILRERMERLEYLLAEGR